MRREEIRDQLIRDSSSLSHSSLGDYDMRTKVGGACHGRKKISLKQSHGSNFACEAIKNLSGIKIIAFPL